ncbi:CHAT domain-containing protein [Ephemerocybe angulata]|uniref:CHAT domain-containing protein n=1 Tax=Ephemerocybe angulata TaxID=980116 RepID=A0A8H6HQN5_9AGAR|nr:CHAT domain-containing protein [Tulosesus angulatus]
MDEPQRMSASCCVLERCNDDERIGSADGKEGGQLGKRICLYVPLARGSVKYLCAHYQPGSAWAVVGILSMGNHCGLKIQTIIMLRMRGTTAESEGRSLLALWEMVWTTRRIRWVDLRLAGYRIAQADQIGGPSTLWDAVRDKPLSGRHIASRSFMTDNSTTNTQSAAKALSKGAISKLRRAVELTPDGHARMASRVHALGTSLEYRFYHTGAPRDLDEAIIFQQKAVELTPDGHADMPDRLVNLGRALNSRFERTGELKDANEAMVKLRKAVTLTPDGHASMPTRLNTLAMSLQSRFHRTGERRAVELTQDLHSDKAMWLIHLGIFLGFRFQCTRQLEDNAEAISVQRKAVELAPVGHPFMPTWLNNLANSIESRFQRTGDLQTLDEAISIQRRAVELPPNDRVNMPLLLGALSTSLRTRFERTGELQNLSEAISIQRKALELTPIGHADIPLWLTSLGLSLELHFERTGEVQDLNEAIALQRRAVALAPDRHVNMPNWLNNLANMPNWLSNLGNSLRSRFHSAGELQDIDEVIALQRKAVEFTPDGHADMSARLTALGVALRSRFERTEELEYITEAIAVQRRAVEVTPDGHVNVPSILGALDSTALVIRLTRTFTPLGTFVPFLKLYQCVGGQSKLTPEGDANLAPRLNSLGMSLGCRFQGTGEPQDLVEAISKFEGAASYAFGPPHIRLDAAKKWTQLLNLSYPPSLSILTAFDAIIHLVTLTVTLDQTLEHRYNRLQDSSGLPLQAASAAFTHNRIEKALEWLEQGRCLVWGQLINLRTPLDDLRRFDSELADRITEVSVELEAAGSSRAAPRTDMSLSEKVASEEAIRNTLNLAREWDSLLAKVRALPGFETFLEPVPCYTLFKNLPESGPVIVINVDIRRCDALALLAGQDQPIHIPLPDFSLELCNQYRETSEDVDGERGIRVVSLKGKKGETVIRTILRCLWEKLVNPILRKLGLLKIDDQSSAAVPPRIWWCPTGPLSFLPIHAAGIYGASGSESVLDYAVSSYIPTVTALTDRVKNSRLTDKTATGLFMTSQPKVMGAPSIPGTTEEVLSVYDVVKRGGVRVDKLEGTAITAAECLDVMETYSMVHLACHASQNAEDPLKSRFLFYESSLELGSIVQRNLKNADLAFLSACQTSTGVQSLPDEAVHLAAGMLAAGYRRVVATMWSIGDRDAPAVATDFYQYLLDHSGPAAEVGFDGRSSAYALHYAIKQLRLRLKDNSDQSLLTWIPYVHFGY